MANITAALVKELRERTGAGMMDCKKALVDCDGDMDKAIDFLREKGSRNRTARIRTAYAAAPAASTKRTP